VAIQIIDLDARTLDPLVIRALRRLHLRLEQVRAADRVTVAAKRARIDRVRRRPVV
jgi:hypothetical protein